MARWALIVDDRVVTVTESEQQPHTFAAAWVECPAWVGPGWTREGQVWRSPVDLAPRHVSVGAFKDRLGMDALAIAVSSHPVCVALREMLYDRKFVDLERADVASFLDMLIFAQQPAADPNFPGSGPMTTQKKAAILGAPIAEGERP